MVYTYLEKHKNIEMPLYYKGNKKNSAKTMNKMDSVIKSSI